MRPALIVAICGMFCLLPAPGRAQDAGVSGEQAFNNSCRTCHTIKDGDNRVGPHLHGIIGRKAGSVEKFPYSEAMKSAGIVWDENTLTRFIEDPEAVVSGNGMKPYAGVRSAEDRAKIVAFLKSGDK